MFFLSLLLTSSLAQAAPFEQMSGTYQISECKEVRDHAEGNHFCKFDQLSIDVTSLVSVFHFYTANTEDSSYEVTTYPLSPDQNIGYEYQEITDIYAAITRTLHTGDAMYDFNTTTSLTKLDAIHYLLVVQSEMPGLDRHQSFEIHLTKISDNTHSPD